MTDPDPETSRPETSDSSPPTVRRPLWPWVTGVVLLGMIGAAVAVWSLRVELANAYGPGLAQRFTGLPVTFTVDRLDLDSLRFSGLSAGADGPTLDEMEIVPDPTGVRDLLWAALFGAADAESPVPIDTLTLKGVSAGISLSETGQPRIDGLPALSGDETAEEDGLPALPARRVEIDGLNIRARTPLGPQRLTGRVLLDFPSAPAALPLTADASLDAPDSESALIAKIALSPDRAAIETTLDLSLDHWLPFVPAVESAQGRVTASLSATGTPDAARGSNFGAILAALSGEAELGWTGVRVLPNDGPMVTLADASAEATLTDGALRVALPRGWEAAADRLPTAWTRALPDPLRPYADGPVQVTLDQTGEAPSVALRARSNGGWSVGFGLRAEAALGPLSLALTPRRVTLTQALMPDILEMEAVQLTAVRGLDLPRDIDGSLTIEPFSLDLAGFLEPGGGIPALTLPYRLDAGIYGTLAGPLWADRTMLTIAGEARLSEAAESLSLTVDPGGSLKVAGLTGTGDVRLSPRLRLDVAGRDPMRVGMRLADPTGSLTVAGAFRLAQTSVAMPGSDPPLALSFERQPISVSYGPERIALAMGPVDVGAPGRDAALDGMVLRLNVADQTASADLTANGLRYGGAVILPGSLTANMAASWAGDGTVTLDGPLSLADGRITANLRARADRTGEAATEIELETAPIRFGPDALTLSDVLPPDMLDALPRIPAMEGSLALAAALSLPERGPQGDLTVTLDQLTAEMPDGGLRALTGTVRFDVGQLPATRGTQTLDGILALRGLPPIPLTARFQAQPDASVTIESLSLGLFDGALALIDATLDPAGPTLDGTLRLRRLDMAQAVAAAAIDGVEAEGRLSGLIPLSVGATDAVIRDGTLAAEGNGVLRIDNPGVNQALATDQEAVQLLTEALKDFRYDKLSADVELPPGEEGRLALSLHGSNPTVLDGHPFEINVNLETDFRRLFSILRDFLDLSTTILGNVRSGAAARGGDTGAE